MILSILKKLIPNRLLLWKFRNSDVKVNAQNDQETHLKKGFSIIELLIVMAIIAALIAVALGYKKFLDTSKEDATRQKMATLDMVLEMYKGRIGSLPTDLKELIEGPSNPTLRKRWGESLTDEKALKDAWGNDFVYEADTKKNKYELYSTGKAGEAKLLSPTSQEI